MRVGRRTITVVWHAVHGGYFWGKGCVVKRRVSVSNKLCLNSLYLGLFLSYSRFSDKLVENTVEDEEERALAIVIERMFLVNELVEY